MNKLLLKFDDFIDKIEHKVKPPIHRVLIFLFVPKYGFDFAIRWFVLFFTIIGIYLLTYIPILNDFSNTRIIGTISSSRVGVTGSGNIRFSGNAEYYYFKLDGYKCTFLMSNKGSFLGEGMIYRGIFTKGNRIETTIVKNDFKRLFINTPSSSINGREFPDHEDCVRIYGMDVNGEKINSKYNSLLCVSYFNNFGWLIPLWIYFIGLSVGGLIILRSRYFDREVEKKYK
jgi:hypothetical protein